MRICVCLKFVPATSAAIRVPADGRAPNLQDVEWEVNPYDDLALGLALQVRERLAGSAEMLALSVGAAEAERALRYALALGFTAGHHIRAEGLDAAAAARCAAAALRPLACDLVLCGRQACDDDQWLFPGALAEQLGWPLLTAVCAFGIVPDGKRASFRRRVAGGEEAGEVLLPAVVSCDRGVPLPPVPTIKGRLESKKRPLVVRTPAELGVEAGALASAFEVVHHAPPPIKTPRRILSGPPAASAAELVRLLREEKVLS